MLGRARIRAGAMSQFGMMNRIFRGIFIMSLQRLSFAKTFHLSYPDKGGIGETRNTNLDVNSLKADLRKYRDMLIDIKNGKVCV